MFEDSVYPRQKVKLFMKFLVNAQARQPVVQPAMASISKNLEYIPEKASAMEQLRNRDISEERKEELETKIDSLTG